MKTARILAAAALAIAPALSFADAGHGLTRADVRTELVQLEQAGYNPARSEPHYPDDVAAATLRVAQSDQNGPSKSDGDDVAETPSPVRDRDMTQARVVHHDAIPSDDIYAHS
ncbi:hypothetical protein WK57_24040 [Burkholderia ubonensis]|uniref:DUF4148 domain-containing protein n=1 Tax=Burkholderia ubonensis TaxID=101571 RepID=A0AA40R2W4_9BURK|nr:DUF4148 domain-containing protein [Burkholderia ubonensis]KVU14449.1 hypothetical protein WK64_10500 [Burkholderia ubonensis]KWZ52193.1 hypothetical protein WK57_24040 [Burkholderia ubonensis]